MNRTQKIVVSIAAAGVGLVLAANPSNAMPWGDSLRPSFLAVSPDRVDEPAADQTASPDPTLPASAGEPISPTPEPTTAATEPHAPEPTSGAPTPTEPSTTAAPTPTEPPHSKPTEPAHPTGSEPATPGTDPNASPEPPREPEHPSTTAPRTEVHTAATLSLSCSLVAGEARSNVACAWSGDAPDAAVRLLVLRGDGTVGRVRLNTEQLGVRSFLDTDAGAGKTFSFVVVFLDANDTSIAHSNGVHVTTPAAPVTTEPPTTEPPTTEPPTTAPPTTRPPTTEPHHPEPTTAPA